MTILCTNVGPPLMDRKAWVFGGGKSKGWLDIIMQK